MLHFDHNRPVMVWGDNNQGKTNFLESLFTVINGESPIQSDRTLLVNSNSEEGIVGVEFLYQDQVNQLYVKLRRDGGRYITLNQQTIRSFSKVADWIDCYFLSADVIRLFQDSPEGRRKVIDLCCNDYCETYRVALKQYMGILKRKNRALKTESEPLLIETLNQQLLPYAVQIVSDRHAMINQLTPILMRLLKQQLTFEVSEVKIVYITKHLTPQLVDIEAGVYEEALQKRWADDSEKERCIGYTLVGPHRDDFEIYIDGKSLFLYYSRGINRIVSILFNLAIIELKKQYSNTVLLLDDIFIELDNAHKGALIRLVEEKAQVFYATVQKSDQQFFSNPVVYHVNQGQLV
jgi:DNA replication and repair protein RecF